MKRILLLIKGLGRGGAEQILASAGPYLDRSRFEYEVAYLLPWKSALVADLERMEIPVRCLNGGRGAVWVNRMRTLARDRRIDLVHAHSPYAAIAARESLGRRIRHVYTEHNVWDRYHRATYWGNMLTFPGNDFVFAVSDRVRTSIRYPRALRGRRMPPVETLYHGLDLQSVTGWAGPAGVREELGIPEGAPIVGTVANFKAHKGHRWLLDAAVPIREAIPDARFVLVGTGQLEADIRRQAVSLGLDGSVIFAGFREDATRIAAAFDLFVLPSLHEGLPVALVEAMALGVPAVVSSVGGVPEVLEHGRHGLLVPPGQPRQLADAVVSLLRDAPMRERMGEEARSRARQFDIRNAVRRVEQVYEEVLA